MMSLWDIACPNEIKVTKNNLTDASQALITNVLKYRAALTETMQIFAKALRDDLGKIDGEDVTVNDYLELITPDFLNGVINARAAHVFEALKKEKDLEETVKTIIEAVTSRPGAFTIKDANGLIQHLKGEYRTRAKAGGGVLPLQANLATITLPGMEYGVSLQQEGNAYLMPLKRLVADKLQFDSGILYFKNDNGQREEFTEARLKANTTNGEGIDNINLPLLRLYYTAILKRFEERIKEMRRKGEQDSQEIEERLLSLPVTFYIPDLMQQITGRRNYEESQLKKVINETASFNYILGVIYDYKHRASIYPVLSFMGYDAPKNIIIFASPYLGYLIRSIYEGSIRHDKKGLVMHNKRGAPMLEASHSYLIKSSIVSERNRDAAANVSIIVTLIEQAGGKGAHISAAELIRRNPSFKKRLQGHSNQRLCLKRTFSKTWELLRTQTRLEEVYKGITLPAPDDPANIPVPSNLETKVFSFTHKGKKKAKAKEEKETSGEPLKGQE